MNVIFFYRPPPETEQSPYAGYQLAYEVKKLMYALFKFQMQNFINSIYFVFTILVCFKMTFVLLPT
jgi:hypothetical protein